MLNDLARHRRHSRPGTETTLPRNRAPNPVRLRGSDFHSSQERAAALTS